MIRHLLRLSMPVLALLAACEESSPPNNPAVENACLEACAASATMCTAAEPTQCTSACGAYGVLIAPGTACEAAYLEYQACRESATFTCIGDVAFVAGTECDIAEAACDASCDSPCL